MRNRTPLARRPSLNWKMGTANRARGTPPVGKGWAKTVNRERDGNVDDDDDGGKREPNRLGLLLEIPPKPQVSMLWKTNLPTRYPYRLNCHRTLRKRKRSLSRAKKTVVRKSLVRPPALLRKTRAARFFAS